MVLKTNKLYGIPELLNYLSKQSLEDIVGVQPPSSLVYLVSPTQVLCN